MHLCENGSSKLVSIKIKYRFQLDPKDELPLAIINAEDMEAIMKSLKAYSSHWIIMK